MKGECFAIRLIMMIMMIRMIRMVMRMTRRMIKGEQGRTV